MNLFASVKYRMGSVFHARPRHLHLMASGLFAAVAMAIGTVDTAYAQSGVPRVQSPPSSGYQGTRQTARPKASQTGKKKPLVPLTPAQTADAILADTLDRLLAQSDRHFHEGEYNQIINLNRFIVQGNPNDVEAYANNAWLLWSTDRNDLAIATLKQGLVANPNTYYMNDELGLHYLVRLKDAKTALPYFEEAVKYDCPATTWHGLANCYEKMGQWEKAVSAWESASKYKDDRLALVRLERARKKLAAQPSGNQ